MQNEDYNWISVRAHEIWQSEGCPNGRDREHWRQALEEWQRRQHLPGRPKTALRENVSRVLVVDDEPLIRFATVEALEEAGFDVLEAGNADEALVLLQTNVVDAVFTDVNMPGTTDGLGLMAQVRARSPQTRVIVTLDMCAWAPSTLRVACRSFQSLTHMTRS